MYGSGFDVANDGDGCWRVPEEEPRRSIMSVDRANLIDNLIELMKIAGSASRVTRI